MYTYTITVPTKKAFSLLVPHIKEIGGSVLQERKTLKKTKKTGLEQALEDIEKGNLIHYGTIEEYKEKTKKFFK
jgi:hypothetical protein